MDLEAVVLQGAIFLLPFGVEEVQSDALEEGLGLWQVQSLKRFKTGLSGWRGITSPSVCAPSRQPKGGYRGSGAPGGSGQGPLHTPPSPPPGDTHRRGHREELS